MDHKCRLYAVTNLCFVTNIAAVQLLIEILDELVKDGNLKSMGVKNVVNIPTDHVETALSLSAETFKVMKCSKSRPFTVIDYMIYVIINNST